MHVSPSVVDTHHRVVRALRGKLLLLIAHTHKQQLLSSPYVLVDVTNPGLGNLEICIIMECVRRRKAGKDNAPASDNHSASGLSKQSLQRF